jgi:DNA-binding response OmpR family regulator
MPPMPAVPHRILIVDDDYETRLAIADVLVAAGYEVLEAGDGRTAVALAAKDRPDLVLLDLILPDAAGFEVLRQLRRLPAGDGCKVVAMSGFPERKEDALPGRERFTAYLLKPFGEAELLGVIRKELVDPRPQHN